MKSPAPIIAEPKERGRHDFRRINDSEKVVRFNDQKPAGFTNRLYRYLSITGTSKPQACAALTSFIEGTERHIELERDPSNRYDRNAIKVIGEWIDCAGDRHVEQLGWIPAAAAKDVAGPHELAAMVECMYRGTSTESPGLKISVWRSCITRNGCKR